MENKNLYDAVIVGGGPAGLTAAIYLARARYRVIVVEKEKFGGQITITAEVVNYPGAEVQSGAELTEKMRKQAEYFGAEFMLADVEHLDFDEDVKHVKTSRGTLDCLSVLLATGAHPRKIGFAGEKEFQGHGVAYCATCDGEFFTGKEVFVVGGGFAAAEEAVFLTRYASHVTVLVRGNDFSCAKEAVEKVVSHPKITVLRNTEVVSVSGDHSLRKMIYRNNKTGEETEYSSGDDTFGVFVFAGYEPSTALIKELAELDPHGYVITDNNGLTTREGLYAAGDVRIKTLRQVVTATADGAIAATEMEKYISSQRAKTGLTPVFKEPQKETVQKKVETKDDGSLLDAGMKEQLNAVFSRFDRNLILEVHTDDRQVSADLVGYAEALAELTDRLQVKKVTGTQEEGLPFVRVLQEDGTYAGFTFHGAPGGHEFTSFVLGLYNAGSAGQAVDDAVKAKINAVDKPVHLTVMVSLSCTMCPELVTAAERIVTMNPHITMDTYDLNHYGEMKEKYKVMSVPCFFINEGPLQFGKKNVEELMELIHQA